MTEPIDITSANDISGQIDAAHGIDYVGKKMGMWIFLFTEVLFFGGLFLLYSVFRSKYTLEFHNSASELDLVFGAVNTAILLLSSMTMAVSIALLRDGRKGLSMLCQGITISLGVVFLINKYMEWSAHIQHGVYPDSPLLLGMSRGKIVFFSLYYVMTGIHGLHVLIGICVISGTLFLTSKGVINMKDFIKLENTGLYWHLVDIIWIYLFPLFYLIT